MGPKMGHTVARAGLYGAVRVGVGSVDRLGSSYRAEPTLGGQTDQFVDNNCPFIAFDTLWTGVLRTRIPLLLFILR